MKNSYLKIAIIFWTIFTLTGCIGFQKWTRNDQLLFGSFVGLNAVDFSQYDKDNEINWFKGQSRGTVGLIKVAGIGFIYVLADNWEDARTPILVVGNVLFGGVVIWNESQQ